jgi:hypothetical protein
MTKSQPKYNLDFLTKAHSKSSSHKTEILSGNLCGCFYCKNTFIPSEITEWIEEPKGGETAVCPKCGIDSILSFELPITDKEFLDEMNNYWFS